MTAGRRATWGVVIATVVCTLLAGVGTGVASAGTARPTAAAASCHPYPDVDASNLHCANIAWLKDRGITKPVGGEYHPADSVTRRSMAAFLFRLTHPGQPQPACTSKPFPDVGLDNPFCGYIAWARSEHIAYGYPDGTYKPDSVVTRGAMVAYLYRVAVPAGTAKSCNESTFQDVSSADEFCPVISWAAKYGITFGADNGITFSARRAVSRQSMASFLHRVVLLQHATVTTTYRTYFKDTAIAQLPDQTVYDPSLAVGVTSVQQGHPGTLRTSFRQKYVDGVASGDPQRIYRQTVKQPTATITRIGTANTCLPTARACVDLTHNVTWLQSGGAITYGPVPMLSGRPGYRTPSGTFQVYWKDKDHRSSIYDDAPMPNSVFFVGGVAFHAGSLSVLSHGCIHLSYSASEVYWDNLSYGDTVSVFGYAPY